MNKDLLIYFLFLLVPLCIFPFATHNLLSGEMARGRDMGRFCLQAQAQTLATEMKALRTKVPPADTDRPPLAIYVVEADGTANGQAVPDDGRCIGSASLDPVFPGCSVRVMWPGEDPGRKRRDRLFRAELIVGISCGLVFLLGSALIIHAAWRSRREARRRFEYVRDFSHRLKTPLTSISLCAELASAGRLDETLMHESMETVAAEAAKLNDLVDEVLADVEGTRHA